MKPTKLAWRCAACRKRNEDTFRGHFDTKDGDDFTLESHAGPDLDEATLLIRGSNSGGDKEPAFCPCNTEAEAVNLVRNIHAVVDKFNSERTKPQPPELPVWEVAE